MDDFTHVARIVMPDGTHGNFFAGTERECKVWEIGAWAAIEQLQRGTPAEGQGARVVVRRIEGLGGS